MLAHLELLTIKAIRYSWVSVRAFHKFIAKQVEQRRLDWQDLSLFRIRPPLFSAIQIYGLRANAQSRGRLSTFQHSSFENEALENEDRSRMHPNLENEAPKTRHRSVLYKHETNVNTAGIKHDNESNSPVSHHRAWFQAITLEQILPGSDLI